MFSSLKLTQRMNKFSHDPIVVAQLNIIENFRSSLKKIAQINRSLQDEKDFIDLIEQICLKYIEDQQGALTKFFEILENLNSILAMPDIDNIAAYFMSKLILSVLTEEGGFEKIEAISEEMGPGEKADITPIENIIRSNLNQHMRLYQARAYNKNLLTDAQAAWPYLSNFKSTRFGRLMEEEEVLAQVTDWITEDEMEQEEAGELPSLARLMLGVTTSHTALLMLRTSSALTAYEKRRAQYYNFYIMLFNMPNNPVFNLQRIVEKCTPTPEAIKHKLDEVKQLFLAKCEERGCPWTEPSPNMAQWNLQGMHAVLLFACIDAVFMRNAICHVLNHHNRHLHIRVVDYTTDRASAFWVGEPGHYYLDFHKLLLQGALKDISTQGLSVFGNRCETVLDALLQHVCYEISALLVFMNYIPRPPATSSEFRGVGTLLFGHGSHRGVTNPLPPGTLIADPRTARALSEIILGSSVQQAQNTAPEAVPAHPQHDDQPPAAAAAETQSSDVPNPNQTPSATAAPSSSESQSTNSLSALVGLFSQPNFWSRARGNAPSQFSSLKKP